MNAINVQETTTTTGTGPITLTGSSEDGRTFISQYQINQKFTYYIESLTGDFETGSGYLSSASVLVREFVLSSSNSDLLVSFGAGAKQVFISPSSAEPDYPSVILSTSAEVYGRYIMSNHWSGIDLGSHANAVDRLYLTPYVNRSTVAFTKWSVRVKTAAVGGIARLGIYQIDPLTGKPTGFPFMESDDIDCSSTVNSLDISFSSNTVNALSSKVLPANFYYAISFNDASIRLQAKSQGNSLWMLPGNNATLTGLTALFTMGTPTQGVAAMPDLSSLGITNNYGEVAVGGFNND